MRSRCPDCQAELPVSDGPTHRYLGASPACWALFSALVNAGDPPLAPHPLTALLVDAYAAQHPGVPGPQAIQSVAVHVLALEGVFNRKVAPDNAQWVRLRALRGRGQGHRFRWLDPPSFAGSITIAEIVKQPTASARSDLAARYAEEMLQLWRAAQGDMIDAWYEQHVLANHG